MSNQFGKIALVSGYQIIVDVGGTGLAGIVIGNESGLTCAVTLQGANVKKTLYPGTVDKFEVPKGRSWSGNLQIDPTSDLNNTSSWPSSHIYVDTYGVGETISGQYPMVLNRAGNIGNAITTVSGSSTSVQNDNNAVGTSVVEATTLGSPTSNVSIDNSGSGWFGVWNNPVFTKIFQWFLVGTTALKLGAVGNFLTQVLGNFQVDGNSTLTGNNTLMGNTTVGGTLGVTGNTTVSTISSTGAATLSSAAVTNNETVGGTLGVTGNTTLSTVNATGLASLDTGILIENNNPLQWENAADAPVTVMQVDGSNNTQIFGVTGLDLIQMLSGAGVLALVFDLINKGLDIKTTAKNIVGVTNGNATFYQFLVGTNVKAGILFFNVYRNAGGIGQVMPLPVPFTQWAMWFAGNGPKVTPQVSGVNLVSKVRVVTTLAVGGGGNTASNFLGPNGFGDIIQTFDGFDLGNTQAANLTALYFFIGQ
jgi:hypothetical protein